MELSNEPGRCEATFTIEAADAQSATALAIEGVRAVRGEVTLGAVTVAADRDMTRGDL